MISAEEARSRLINPQSIERLKIIADTRIKEAIQKGECQCALSIHLRLYTKIEIDCLKEHLRSSGYRVLPAPTLPDDQYYRIVFWW